MGDDAACCACMTRERASGQSATEPDLATGSVPSCLSLSLSIERESSVPWRRAAFPPLSLSLSLCIYIYIYREREREREQRPPCRVHILRARTPGVTGPGPPPPPPPARRYKEKVVCYCESHDQALVRRRAGPSLLAGAAPERSCRERERERERERSGSPVFSFRCGLGRLAAEAVGGGRGSERRGLHGRHVCEGKAIVVWLISLSLFFALALSRSLCLSLPLSLSLSL